MLKNPRVLVTFFKNRLLKTSEENMTENTTFRGIFQKVPAPYPTLFLQISPFLRFNFYPPP